MQTHGATIGVYNQYRGYMPRTTYNAAYALRVLKMLVPLSDRRRVARFLLLMMLLVPVSRASDWRAPAEQLARKIAVATGPGAVAVKVGNRSSLSNSEVEEIRRALLAELGALGVHFVNADQAAVTVQISLSENLQDYVWVAEIHQGDNQSSVVMVAAPRPNAAMTEHPPAGLTVHKALLWSDENRILDVAMVNANPQHMILLEPENILLYRLQDSRWQQEQEFPVPHLHPWPRDLRGRLVLRKDHLFDAYLPGIFCRSTATAPLAVNCFESDDPWPLVTWPLGAEPSGLSAFFASTRNFFTGALSPGIEKQTTAPAFYSAAALPRNKYTLWLFAAVDGRVHLLDGITDQTAARLGWGSDIASVKSGCGLGWQILATGNGDGMSDTVRAFEIADREPVAVSQPVEFTGNVTALWTEADANSAIAVSQNSETGRYEAYRLSLTCGL